MNIEIYSDTKIYVVAPANTATGGPELLHQLAYKLRNDLGIEAYMYYTPLNIENPVHSNYKEYNNPYIRFIEDSANNILIVPEVTNGLQILGNFNKIRKVIWWLSVDNFTIPAVLSVKKNFFVKRSINKITKILFCKEFFDISEDILKRLKKNNIKKIYIPKFYLNLFYKNSVLHLAQSYYALDFIKNIGISQDKTFYLSDYLNENFLKTHTNILIKENIVAYNPKKGFSFTKKIINAAHDIKFIPLINMTRIEVIETLQKAKVYIDFGNHPGKDRIPREAAILGCCVLLGKRGSAAYYEDVSIPDQYKFEDKEENITKIVDTIKDCFRNFEERYKDFEYYRQIIKNEPKKFIEDLKKIFVKVEKNETF